MTAVRGRLQLADADDAAADARSSVTGGAAQLVTALAEVIDIGVTLRRGGGARAGERGGGVRTRTTPEPGQTGEARFGVNRGLE